MRAVAVEQHQDRARAESFGDDAERYDRARPSYPGALVDDLMAAAPHDVLDVGCGTGIVSRLFVARACRVIGVEIDPRMAAVARRYGLTVEVARFEGWDAAGRSFDLLVCGQAWHWVDPVRGAHAAAAVLRPGGRFAVFWNEHVHAPEVLAAMDEVYEAVAPELIGSSRVLGTARHSIATDPARDRIVQAVQGDGGFTSVEGHRYVWEMTYTVEEWLSYIRTTSDHHRLEPPRLEALVAGLRTALLARGDTFAVGYETRMLTAARAPHT